MHTYIYRKKVLNDLYDKQYLLKNVQVTATSKKSYVNK
jgi:hypothetical protein